MESKISLDKVNKKVERARVFFNYGACVVFGMLVCHIESKGWANLEGIIFYLTLIAEAVFLARWVTFRQERKKLERRAE